MATWDTEEKSGGLATEQDLLIEDTFQLLIGDGFSLLIQEEGVATSWTNLEKEQQ